MKKNFYFLQSFEKILKEIVTGSAFNTLSFKKALTDGALLTEDIVYLASLRGSSWLKTCICATRFSREALPLCSSLYEGSGSFWSLCISGYRDETGNVPPNYFMAFNLDPDVTLTYLSTRGLWSLIEQDIMSKLLTDSELWAYCQNFVETAKKNK